MYKFYLSTNAYKRIGFIESCQVLQLNFFMLFNLIKYYGYVHSSWVYWGLENEIPLGHKASKCIIRVETCSHFSFCLVSEDDKYWTTLLT